MKTCANHSVRSTAASALIVLFAAGVAFAQPRYLATAIPVTTDDESSATGINAAGVVVGYGYHWGATGTGFAYDAGWLSDLGLFVPWAISDRGEIAGHTSDYPSRAALMTGGVMREVGPTGAYASRATAINEAGDVAGVFQPSAADSPRGFAVIGGAVAELGTLGGVMWPTWSIPAAIGDHGEVVGASGVEAGKSHAFLWRNGTMSDLGTLGGSTSVAADIDRTGQIVGRSSLAGDTASHLFLHAGGSMHDLGAAPSSMSRVSAFNVAGEIIGAYSAEDGTSRAFVYSGGIARDLTSLVEAGLGGPVLRAANAINAAGQIAADACTKERCFAVRLDPLAGSDRVAIEYHHAEFDHYFVTADPSEIAMLDGDSQGGWARTGQAFAVGSGPRSGSVPVCRFFSTAFGAGSSHFYTASPWECAYLKTQLAHDWIFEGQVFTIAIPDEAGFCPERTVPIYRVYNNGHGGAPNHRFTTSLTIRARMLAAGWIPEGYGALGVSMCAFA